MTNNFPRVTAILSRIPDAATRWPGWFAYHYNPNIIEAMLRCLEDAVK